jgi:hypothetical protein
MRWRGARGAAALRFGATSPPIGRDHMVQRVEQHGSRERVGSRDRHGPSKPMPHRDISGGAAGPRSLTPRFRHCAIPSVRADTSMTNRFFRRIGVTFKKDACRARAGSAGHQRAAANEGEPIRASSHLNPVEYVPALSGSRCERPVARTYDACRQAAQPSSLSTRPKNAPRTSQSAGYL